MIWTTPAGLVAEVERLWTSGRILRAGLSGEPLFPRRLKLRRPDRAAMSDRFGEVRDWIQALENAGKAKRGFGYDIVWSEINHRQLGRNRVPEAVVVAAEGDALQLISKEKAAHRFGELASATLRQFPELREWLLRRPMVVLEHAEDWPRLMAVVGWLRDHPDSGLYLRQLDIEGVDTKFIEQRKGLVSELLGARASRPHARPNSGDLGEDAGGTPAVPKSFEARCGLRSKPALVRFRILDDRLAIAGMTDLSIPSGEFAGLEIPASRVFITENEINGLSLPPVTGAIVVFGLGYGVDLLVEAKWLAQRPLLYWGDIDTHGFAILDRLRAHFPHARALLMDRETLIAHRALWGSEEQPNITSL